MMISFGLIWTLFLQNSNFIGLVASLIGTLYMAYDLFGKRRHGPHGPLRTLTEAITYIVIAAVGGTSALGIIAFDAVNYDPYFIHVVTISGAVSVLLTFGASGGVGTGLTYVLTVERKWNMGRPRARRDKALLRITSGLLLGIFEGLFVYIVMYNFRHATTVINGIRWGALQGFPAGLLFGFIVARLLVYFDAGQRPAAISFAPDQTEHMNTTDANDPLNAVGAANVVSAQGEPRDSAALPSPRPPARKPASVHSHKMPSGVVNMLTGLAIGIGVGPVTALSYFALYGPFFTPTFVFISLAGIVGGCVVGIVLVTAQRLLLWIDELPDAQLGIFGAMLVVAGFMFQAVDDVVRLLTPLLR